MLGEEIPQIYAACGRGARSSLRILRPGLAVAELAVWQLPGQPTAVWTLRRSQTDELDALIVVSFANATLVRAPAWTLVTSAGRSGGRIGLDLETGRAFRAAHCMPWRLTVPDNCTLDASRCMGT